MDPGWTEFGRIDADGTVYVRTAAGERAIGSWQAGSVDEGIAHYTRRYEDLTTEVELLASRLRAGTVNPSEAAEKLQRHFDTLGDVAAIGDFDALAARLTTLIGSAKDAAQAVEESRRAARAEAIKQKEAIVKEAEDLAENGTQWKVAGERIRAIAEEWRKHTGVPRKVDAQLWKRFAAARTAFNRRRGSHFAQLDATRKEAAHQKEELIREAEKLSTSTNWKETGSALRNLMTKWKELPRANRETEERLWKQLRTHLDQFYTRRDAAYAERDAEFVENQRKKEELLAVAEKIDSSTDPKHAQQQLRDIQHRWDAIGHVPREVMDSLAKRLQIVERRIRSAVDNAWEREAVENNPLLAQMREQVERAENSLAVAEANGDTGRIREAQEALETKQQLLALAEKSATSGL